MKVKMLVGIAGTIDGRPWPDKGGVIDVAAVVAEDLIANKYAEPVAAAAKAEAASFYPVAETAAKPAARARKRPAED